MRLPRTVPIALSLSALIYVPILILRNALPAMAWEARTGLAHSTMARFLGMAMLAVLTLIVMAACAISRGANSVFAVRVVGGSDLPAERCCWAQPQR